MRTKIVALLALAAAFSVACDSGPTAGNLTMDLTTPVPSLGAVSFRVTSVEPATIDTVTAACTSCQVFTTRISTTEVRGVVTGTVVAGPLLRIAVPDTRQAAAYIGQLLEASEPDYELVTVTGMALTVQ
jgi:hypothetical protein